MLLGKRRGGRGVLYQRSSSEPETSGHGVDGPWRCAEASGRWLHSRAAPSRPWVVMVTGQDMERTDRLGFERHPGEPSVEKHRIEKELSDPLTWMTLNAQCLFFS